MSLHRQDMHCPACPASDTAFTVEDVGVKTNWDNRDDDLRVSFSRPAWEPVMLAHLRSRLDDDEHRRVYDLCIIELMAAEKSAEDVARDEIQAVVDFVRRQLERAAQRLP